MKSIGTLTLWATLVHRAFGFGVTANNDANALAAALFSGPGITIVSASFTGAAASSGTFVDGPFGIGSGAILTTGTAVGALPNGDHYVNNGQPGSSTYCGPSTFNAAILSVDVIVDVGYNGIDFEYIMASEEEGGYVNPARGTGSLLTNYLIDLLTQSVSLLVVLLTLEIRTATRSQQHLHGWLTPSSLRPQTVSPRTLARARHSYGRF